MPNNRRRSAGFTWIASLLTIVSLVAACGGGGGGGGGAAAPVPPPLSSDASLSSLAITGVTLDPAFSTTVTSYTATVPNSSSSVDISAATTDSNARLTINGGSNPTTALAVGENTITVVVSAENGSSTRTYTIVITREAPSLASIQIVPNTFLMIADGASSPTLSISFFDSSGNEIDGSGVSYQLHANGVQQASVQFTTSLAADYELKIVSDAIESNSVTVTAREQKAYPILTLPVVFHVVHFGEPIGIGPNLPASDIDEALNRLNAAYSNQLGSIDPNAVDTYIRFRLATVSPDGSSMTESGINRFDGTAYDDGSPFNVETPGDQKLGVNELYHLMGQNYWSPREYINFWVATGEDGRGSAALPRMLSSNPLPGLDSVPTDYDPNENNFGGLNLSNTGTWIGNGPHEVGHVLGLLHPFSSGQCGPGDYLDDTLNYRLDLPDRPACPGSLGFEESTTIMDYQGTYNTFTYDQRERMHIVLEFGIWVRELQFSTK